MKREIKFRGMSIEETLLVDQGKWVYGYLFSEGKFKYIKTQISIDSGGVGSGLITTDIEVDPETVGEYTGLKDKNGVEIYEFMELDNKWEVNWLNGSYVLRDISNGDIINLNYENEYEITREYTKV